MVDCGCVYHVTEARTKLRQPVWEYGGLYRQGEGACCGISQARERKSRTIRRAIDRQKAASVGREAC